MTNFATDETLLKVIRDLQARVDALERDTTGHDDITIGQGMLATWYNGSDNYPPSDGTLAFTGKLLGKTLEGPIDWTNTRAPNQQYNFSVRIEGWIQPQYTEQYTFYVTSDDGVRLWVNNTALVTTGWKAQGAAEYSGTIMLTANRWYPIIIEHDQGTGGEALKFEWASTSLTREVVPRSRMGYSGKDNSHRKNLMATGAVKASDIVIAKGLNVNSGNIDFGGGDNAIAALSPSLYYHLDRGHAAIDQGSGGHNGTISNTTAGGDISYPSIPGLHELNSTYGNGLPWDGGGSLIHTNWNTPFTSGASFTAMGWANREVSTDNHALMGSTHYPNGVNFYLQTGTNNVVFSPQWGVATTLTWTNAWPGNGQWVHWALSYDQTNDLATLYINGQKVSSQAQTGDYHASVGALTFGRALALVYTFKGQMSHVAFWQNTVLTDAQVASTYQTPSISRTNTGQITLSGPGNMPQPTLVVKSTGMGGSSEAAIRIEPFANTGASTYTLSSDDGTNGFRIHRSAENPGLSTLIFQLDGSAAGQLRLPVVPATPSDGGILLGGDVNIYKNATDELKTDDKFTAALTSFNPASSTGLAQIQLGMGANIGNLANAQIAFSYNKTDNYRHMINTTHNSSGITGNTINFYIWKYGTDAAGTLGTQKALTLESHPYSAQGSLVRIPGSLWLESTGFLDLRSGAVNQPGAAYSSNTGDKIGLYGNDDAGNRYGIGVQSSTLVLYTPTGTGVGIRNAAGSGSAGSSGTEVIRLGGNGDISATGAIYVGAGDSDTGQFIINWDGANDRAYLGFNGSQGGEIQFYANGTSTGATQIFTTSGAIRSYQSGSYLKMGNHTYQTDDNDGKIGTDLFAEGLNIIGVQTVSGNGRKIRFWGDVSGIGALTCDTISTGGNQCELDYGTWTPTCTGVTNVDSCSATGAGQWLRVGNTVTASVELNIDATTQSSATNFRFTLPVASSFSNRNQLLGTAVSASSSIPQDTWALRAETTNDQVEAMSYVTSTANHTINAHFTYRIL